MTANIFAKSTNIPKTIAMIEEDLWQMSYILFSDTQEHYNEIIRMMPYYGFKYENRIGIMKEFEQHLLDIKHKLKTELEARQI